MSKTCLLIILLLSSTLGFGQIPNYVPSNGLIGWWPFTGNAQDLSGNGHHGTVTGATLTTDRFGAASNAYNFDGNDWITLDNLPQINGLNAITISVWVKSSGFNQNQSCNMGCRQFYLAGGPMVKMVFIFKQIRILVRMCQILQEVLMGPLTLPKADGLEVMCQLLYHIPLGTMWYWFIMAQQLDYF